MQHRHCLDTTRRLAVIDQLHGRFFDFRQRIGTRLGLHQQRHLGVGKAGRRDPFQKGHRRAKGTGPLVICGDQIPVDVLVFNRARAPAVADIENLLIAIQIHGIAGGDKSPHHPGQVIRRVPELIGEQKGIQSRLVRPVDFLFGDDIKHEGADQHRKGQQAQSQSTAKHARRIGISSFPHVIPCRHIFVIRLTLALSNAKNPARSGV